MVDRAQVLELVPHYLAMVLIVFVALTAIRLAFGDVGIVVEFGVALGLLFLYRLLVLRFDVAPSSWERDR